MHHTKTGNKTTRLLLLRRGVPVSLLSAAAVLPLRRLVTSTMAAATHQGQVLKLGLAGDTMLGRCVAEVIFQAREPDAPADAEREALPYFHWAQHRGGRSQITSPDESVLFDEPVLETVQREADLIFLNLECCISTSTQRWPNPYKPFFFRAPPVAIHDLKALRVDAVTLGAWTGRR